MNHYLKLWCIICMTLASTTTSAQVDSVRFKMVQSLTKIIKREYVSASIAKQMCDTINWKLANNKYDASLNPDEFAYEITRDLRSISNDRHISVSMPMYKIREEDYSYDSSKVARMNKRQRKRHYEKIKRSWQDFSKKYRERTKQDMYTYGDIRILPGNIGYVEIKDFESTSYNKKNNKGRIPIASVMNFLKNTHSIIIDLRDNQGGFVKQAAIFCSYFSPRTSNYFITTEYGYRYDSSGIEKETKYSSIRLTSDRIDDWYTQRKSIYILTSSRTFSAAELSAYKIKQYKPATTIIGEQTPGGGNGHTGGTTEKYFTAVIPSSKSFDKRNSNYNLEAKGITPDIITPADSALDVAYRLASAKAVPGHKKSRYFKKQKLPRNINRAQFEKYYTDYIGDYRKIRIVIEDKKLFMYYDDMSKIELLPAAVDKFNNSYKLPVKFVRDGNGRVTAIQVKYSKEFTESFGRINSN